MKYERGITALTPVGAGMCNKFSARALPEDAVRNAVNTDFRSTGDIHTRGGYALNYAGNDVHSAFTCSSGSYFVEAGTLKRFAPAGAHTSVFSGISGQCNYCYADGDLFVSDGVKAWRNGAPWGLPVPATPSVDVLAGGGIAEGQVLVAYTFVASDGTESGASSVIAVQAFADSQLFLFGLPIPTDNRVTHIRVYASAPGGEVLYRQADAIVGSVTVTLGAILDSGVELSTHTMTRPPAGSIIKKYNGRMYVAVDDLLWHTEPFALDLVNPGKNVTRFPGDIKIVEPVRDGIWVVADRTFFLGGSGPEDFVQREVLPYGAIPGNSVALPGGDVMWYSERGLIVATDSGKLKNVQERLVAPDVGDSCSVALREVEGTPFAMVSVRNPAVSRLAASDFFDAEVVRRGA